jgi:hypothetical protein
MAEDLEDQFHRDWKPGLDRPVRDISEKVMYTAGVGAGLRRGDYMKHG